MLWRFDFDFDAFVRACYCAKNNDISLQKTCFFSEANMKAMNTQVNIIYFLKEERTESLELMNEEVYINIGLVLEIYLNVCKQDLQLYWNRASA